MAKPARAPMPLSSVWGKEPHHRQIWKAQGNCVICQERPRDIICSRCSEPICGRCAKSHEAAHLREKYIEKIARGEVQHGVPPDEWAEAMSLRAKWEAEEKNEECEN